MEYLLLYVDDNLIFGKDGDAMNVKKKLANNFTITDVGICWHFLGLKIVYLPNGIYIFQRPFVEKIVSPSKMENLKPAITPLPLSHCLYESSRNI